MYKHTWNPVINQVLKCGEDSRAEAKEHDPNAIGVYTVDTVTKQPNAKETLAGHVPTELSRLLKKFLEAGNDNRVHTQVR